MYMYIYIYIHTHTHTHTHTYKFTSKCHRLPHPQSRDSQDQEMVLAPSADKQARNYDTEC